MAIKTYPVHNFCDCEAVGCQFLHRRLPSYVIRKTVSVAVSIFTLTFISVDRWYAICFPLKFRTTTGRAKTAIAVIWVVAILFDIPDLFMLQTIPPTHIRVDTVIYTRCDFGWSVESQTIFTIIRFLFLYAGPLLFMSVAYWQISRVLWRSDIPGHNLSVRPNQLNEIPPPVGGNPEDQLRPRRKAAKMLVAVVFTFAICYLPVHLLNVLRYTITLPSNNWTVGFSLISHWLCYFNSAINPVIYNFMSEKFRKEFRRTFRCCKGTRSHGGGTYVTTNSNYPRLSKLRMTTNNTQRNTEIIPLSAVH